MTTTPATTPAAAAAGTVPVVRARGLTKHYRVRTPAGARRLRAVEDVDLTIAPGSTTALVGESGCGKSTTGRLLLALETPTAGSIEIDGTDLGGLSAKQLRAARRDFQVVFQDPYDSLNGRLSVAQVLAEPARVHRVPDGETRSVGDLLDLVGLDRSFAERFPHELSGGQRQRVAIARAVALDPKFVVCDEAVSALDVSVQAQVINVLRRLQRELGLAYLFISHDLAVVRHVADRTAVMYLGRVVERGDTEQLFASARHPYTRLLLASAPRPRVRRADAPARTARIGEPPSPLARPAGCVFSGRCPIATERCTTEVPALRWVDDREVACHHAERSDVVAS